MPSASDCATAQCASSQPRCGMPSWPALRAVCTGTESVPVPAAAPAAGGSAAAASSEGSTSLPKEPTSAARTFAASPVPAVLRGGSQFRAAGARPVSAAASSAASGSCFAYACGKPLRWTRCAATVSGSRE